MIAYKLFRQRADGSLGSLFIDARARLPVGKWIRAQENPTKGFALRKGWHCLPKPEAPHLSEKGRQWWKVDVKGVETLTRPHAQGCIWYIAKQMKILEPVN